MGQVIAVCGMPGSGKGEFASVLSQHGVPIVSMGDMIRHEVARLGLDETPMIFGEIAAELRAEFGENVLAVRLADHVDTLLTTHSIVLIEGMRGTAEREEFAMRWGHRFTTVAILADEEQRYNRIKNRGRTEDGDRAAFDARNQREIGWGLDVLIDEANFQLANTQELQPFIESIHVWFEYFLKE